MRQLKNGQKTVSKNLTQIQQVSKNNMEIDDARNLLMGHIGYMNIADVECLVDKYFYVDK